MITDKDKAFYNGFIAHVRSYHEHDIYHVPIFNIEETEILEILGQREEHIRAESADQVRKEAAERAIEWLDISMQHVPNTSRSIRKLMLRDAILGDSAPVSTDSEKLGIKNNIDGKCNEIIDRAKTIGGNYYKDVLFLCTEIAMITSTGKLAIAVKALEDIGEYTGDSPVATNWRAIVSSIGTKARDALKEIQG